MSIVGTRFVELAGVGAAPDVVGEVGSVLGGRETVGDRRELTADQRADVRARIAGTWRARRRC